MKTFNIDAAGVTVLHNKEGVVHLEVFATPCPFAEDEEVMLESKTRGRAPFKVTEVFTPYRPGDQHFVYLQLFDHAHLVAFLPMSDGDQANIPITS